MSLIQSGLIWTGGANGSGGSENNDKGVFATKADLVIQYPVGKAGWFAFVDATDTLWYWDTTTNAWIDTGAGFGGVNSVSVQTANGFSGTVANPTTMPSIAIQTTINGLIKGNNGNMQQAIDGIDYLTPVTNAINNNISLLNSNGQPIDSGVNISALNTYSQARSALPNIDFNNIKNNVTYNGYYQFNNSSVLNTPQNQTQGYLIVSIQGTYTSQQFINNNGGSFWRSYNGTAWSPWQQQATANPALITGSSIDPNGNTNFNNANGYSVGSQVIYGGQTYNYINETAGIPVWQLESNVIDVALGLNLINTYTEGQIITVENAIGMPDANYSPTNLNSLFTKSYRVNYIIDNTYPAFPILDGTGSPVLDTNDEPITQMIRYLSSAENPIENDSDLILLNAILGATTQKDLNIAISNAQAKIQATRNFLTSVPTANDLFINVGNNTGDPFFANNYIRIINYQAVPITQVNSQLYNSLESICKDTLTGEVWIKDITATPNSWFQLTNKLAIADLQSKFTALQTQINALNTSVNLLLGANVQSPKARIISSQNPNASDSNVGSEAFPMLTLNGALTSANLSFPQIMKMYPGNIDNAGNITLNNTTNIAIEGVSDAIGAEQVNINGNWYLTGTTKNVRIKNIMLSAMDTTNPILNYAMNASDFANANSAIAITADNFVENCTIRCPIDTQYIFANISANIKQNITILNTNCDRIQDPLLNMENSIAGLGSKLNVISISQRGLFPLAIGANNTVCLEGDIIPDFVSLDNTAIVEFNLFEKVVMGVITNDTDLNNLLNYNVDTIMDGLWVVNYVTNIKTTKGASIGLGAFVYKISRLKSDLVTIITRLNLYCRFQDYPSATFSAYIDYTNIALGQSAYQNNGISWELIVTKADLDNKLDNSIATFIEQASTPTIPSIGQLSLYAKTDDKLYYLNSSGSEVEVGAGSSTASSGELEPIGTVKAYYGTNAPAGYLIADGSTYLKTNYQALWDFAVANSLTTTNVLEIGKFYDNGLNFKVPNLRGQFLRGLGGIDPDVATRTLGSIQADGFKSHQHETMLFENTAQDMYFGGSRNMDQARGTNNRVNEDVINSAGNIGEGDEESALTGPTGISETRPANIALNYIIKAQVIGGSSIVGGLTYLGLWDASTNTPTLPSANPINGQYYKVSVAGTTNIDGTSVWYVGDWIIFNGNSWDKIENSETVFAVNGQTGNVNITANNIGLSNATVQGNVFNNASQLVQLDGSNKLPAVDGSLLTNLPPQSIENLSDSAVINPTAGQFLGFNGVDWGNENLPFASLTENTSSILNITGGSTAVLNATTIQVKKASTSQDGYLSSTDFNTFNNKQDALPAFPLPISYGGTGNHLGYALGLVDALTIGTGLSGGSFDGSVAATIALANTAVSAGSYTNANISVDAQGRITSASNGSGGGSTYPDNKTIYVDVVAGNDITGDGTRDKPYQGVKAFTLSNTVYGTKQLIYCIGTGSTGNNGGTPISLANLSEIKIYLSPKTILNTPLIMPAGGGNVVIVGEGSIEAPLVNNSSNFFNIQCYKIATTITNNSPSLSNIINIFDGQNANAINTNGALAILNANQFNAVSANGTSTDVIIQGTNILLTPPNISAGSLILERNDLLTIDANGYSVNMTSPSGVLRINGNGFLQADQITKGKINQTGVAVAVYIGLNTGRNEASDIIAGIRVPLVDLKEAVQGGTSTQYVRGDGTLQTLNSTAVGLSNVNNTSDANKPISAATQTALNLKLNISATTAVPTANSVSTWDANKNFSANNFLGGFSNTATSITPVTLTVASNQNQDFTGSPAQTVILPNATTLVNGHSFSFFNQSTSSLTINLNGGSNLYILPPLTDISVILLNNSSSAGVWHLISMPPTSNYLFANRSDAGGTGEAINTTPTIALFTLQESNNIAYSNGQASLNVGQTYEINVNMRCDTQPGGIVFAQLWDATNNVGLSKNGIAYQWITERIDIAGNGSLPSYTAIYTPSSSILVEVQVWSNGVSSQLYEGSLVIKRIK